MRLFLPQSRAKLGRVEHCCSHAVLTGIHNWKNWIDAQRKGREVFVNMMLGQLDASH